MHVLETSPAQHDRGLELVGDQLLPWLRESTGFRSDKLSGLTAQTVGVTRLALEEMEVTLFDVAGV